MKKRHEEKCEQEVGKAEQEKISEEAEAPAAIPVSITQSNQKIR